MRMQVQFDVTIQRVCHKRTNTLAWRVESSGGSMWYATLEQVHDYLARLLPFLEASEHIA